MTNQHRNIMVKGSEVSHDSETPINQDWCMVGQITAYDESKAQVSIESVWDKAGTKKTFFAWAKYFGQSGVPTPDEVEVDQQIEFYRTGVGNDPAPAGGYTDFRLDSSDNTKASFVAFFFRS